MRLDSTSVTHETVRRTPRAPSVQSDVVTPVLIAFVTGLAFAVIGWRLRSDPVIWFVGAFLLAWLGTLALNRASLYAIETALNYDLDGDGDVGEPQITRQELDLFVGRPGINGTKQHTRTGFPVDAGRLGELLSGFLEGHTSEGEWASGAGKRFTLAEFRACRDELIRLGLVEWVNPAARARGIRVVDADGLEELRDGLMDAT